MDSWFLGQLFEQAVETVLVDRVVLDTFGLLRYLCDQTLQLLGRLVAFEVLERGEAAAMPLLATTVGAPAPIALPSIPAAGIDSTCFLGIAAGDTASGPAADNAAATVLTAGVAVAQLATDNFPTKVPESPISAILNW